MFDTGEMANSIRQWSRSGLADAVAPATALLGRDDRADHGGRPGRPAPGRDSILPAPSALAPLLPDGGLRRGSTLAIRGTGATSLAFALLAEVGARDGWCAAVGLGSLGLLTAQHAGLDLARLALVPDPGPDWPTVVAALLDAFEIVVLGPVGHASPHLQRRLAARVRERRRVLVSLGVDALPQVTPDVALTGVGGVWEGLGWGSGHLRRRQLQVRAEGRRLAGSSRQVTVWLPDAAGRVSTHGAAPDRVPRPVLVEATA